MSYQYDQYLESHKENVVKAFEWMVNNLPEQATGNWLELLDLGQQICVEHDQSKRRKDEYDAYDAYFYGGNRSSLVVKKYQKAWLTHIHRNPHHWQHWILLNDDPESSEEILEMPGNYVIEMICDWWSFSWKSGDLETIFKWWEEHKDYMMLHPATRALVISILNQIKEKIHGKTQS